MKKGITKLKLNLLWKIYLIRLIPATPTITFPVTIYVLFITFVVLKLSIYILIFVSHICIVSTDEHITNNQTVPEGYFQHNDHNGVTKFCMQETLNLSMCAYSSTYKKKSKEIRCHTPGVTCQV